MSEEAGGGLKSCYCRRSAASRLRGQGLPFRRMLFIVFIAENACAGESLEGRRLRNLCQVIKVGVCGQQRGSSAAMKVREVKTSVNGLGVASAGGWDFFLDCFFFNVKLIKEHLSDAWSPFFF